MKWLVALLVLLNGLVLLYFNMPTGASGTHIGLQPLDADKLKLYTAEQAAQLPKKAAAAADASAYPSPVASCYEWTGLSGSVLTRARNLLDSLGVAAEVHPDETASVGSQRFWVYIPPALTVQLAQNKMRELRALGVKDSYLVQDDPWRNAISLGIFKDEQLAARHLEDLKAIGVRSAVKGVRSSDAGQGVITMRNPADQAVAEIQRQANEFAGAEFKQVNCQ